MINKRRWKKFYEEGDLVVVYLQKWGISTDTLSQLKNKKSGLYWVINKINDITYVIDLPKIWRYPWGVCGPPSSSL